MHMNNGLLICDMCGRQTDGVSTIELKAGYGSKHDGKHKVLQLCGCCYDKLSSIIYTVSK